MRTQNLRLSYNYNNKLDCDCFTVIQRYDSTLFSPGNMLELYLLKQPLGQVEVLHHRTLAEQDINDWISLLNFGYRAVDAVKILRRSFPTTNVNPTYSWALLKYRRRYDPEDLLLEPKPKSKSKTLSLFAIAV